MLFSKTISLELKYYLGCTDNNKITKKNIYFLVQTVVVKLDASLKIEWSQDYGLSTGQDQCFDILVDGSVKTSSVLTDIWDLRSISILVFTPRAGDYLLGGHTTAGEGVVNWDYLAIKV